MGRDVSINHITSRPRWAEGVFRMRQLHERRYAAGVSPAAGPYLMNYPNAMTVQQPAGSSEYSSTFQPSQLARMVFGNKPTRTRVYSVRYSSVAGSASGVSTNVNFQKGAIIKEAWGGSTNATITVGQTAGNFGNLCYEFQLRYGNQDPIFSDYVRGDVAFGANNERGLIFRPALIVLPQNTLNILLTNLLSTTLTTVNIAFLAEEPSY